MCYTDDVRWVPARSVRLHWPVQAFELALALVLCARLAFVRSLAFVHALRGLVGICTGQCPLLASFVAIRAQPSLPIVHISNLL